MQFCIPKIEKRILSFWKKNQIFEKTILKRKGFKDFVFYEGPPTANARPGIHHVLSRVFKDIICRFKTMEGFRVLRKAGWDTHGLPVELEIEKKLGFKTKKEIENFGIEKFNKECKKSVWQYKKEWEKLTERIGFWLDLKKPYITYEPEYIETVWFILKKIWEKGFLYQDFKVSPYCPRCQTVLSSHELAQGYKKIKEPAIFVKFKILNPQFENSSLLVWTTTPWTLPANVAVAVNPEFVYVKAKIGEESLILAKERIKFISLEYKVEKEFLGKELVGLRYQAPFDFYSPDFKKEKIWEVLPANFVSLEEGTGLVHIAPAFGEEDMELIKIQNSKCKKENEKEIPILINVDEEGRFKLDVKKWAKIFVKDADPLIIQDLKERNLLFREEIYEHDYPFCWRCKTPLIYYAKKSWFIKMTAIKEKLLKNNQKINWIPVHIKEGRFGEWLKEIKDWALSRERYWGTPLPIWKCQNCNNLILIGSLEELKSQRFLKNKYLILRHGEATSNLKQIIISEVPERFPAFLTKKGEKQIKNSVRKLKKENIDLIFSSDLERTKATAQIIAQKLNKKVIFDKRLREIRAGELEGKNLREFRSFWKNVKEKFSKRPKEGENFLDVQKRMLSFWKELEKKYEGKTILIISHQLPLAMLQAFFEDWNQKNFAEKYEKEKLANGEFKELKFIRLPKNKKGEIDLHRPYIDGIKIFCPQCKGLMKRVQEVIDCWFDSGSMPFAQYHWPFSEISNKSFKNLGAKPPKLFPADYIAEGMDQTRGWFYTLLAISTLLDFGPPYKNVISLGHVLDEKGEKMSKSKGNVIDPWFIIEKYGADVTRWYFFTANQPADPKLFSEKGIQESQRRLVLTLWNCILFFRTYCRSFQISINKPIKKSNALDSWIISKTQQLILNITKNLEKFLVTQAARLIEDFIIKDLSLWYIRLSRKRFQKPRTKKDFEEATQTLGYVLLTISKLLAPFLPFLSEYFYLKIIGPKYKNLKSVHLENWPRANKILINKALEEKMEKARKIVALVLAERKKVKIKVRQPLPQLIIPDIKIKKEDQIVKIIQEETNVKKIIFGKKFFLDTKITPELKEEGIIREVVRHIQETRKKMGLRPKDKIMIKYKADGGLAEILLKNQLLIVKEANIRRFEEDKEGTMGFEKMIKIDGKNLAFNIKKL